MTPENILPWVFMYIVILAAAYLTYYMGSIVYDDWKKRNKK